MKKNIKKEHLPHTFLETICIEHCTRTFSDKIASDFKGKVVFQICYEIFGFSNMLRNIQGVLRQNTYLYGLESSKTLLRNMYIYKLRDIGMVSYESSIKYLEFRWGGCWGVS